jgi:hypothetical protein
LDDNTSGAAIVGETALCWSSLSCIPDAMEILEGDALSTDRIVALEDTPSVEASVEVVVTLSSIMLNWSSCGPPSKLAVVIDDMSNLCCSSNDLDKSIDVDMVVALDDVSCWLVRRLSIFNIIDQQNGM